MAHYTTITSDKNKDTALLLCIFGGLFGLHQFYVGKIGKGLLYLFTFGLFMIGWIIDIFSILSGSFKDNAGAPLRATKSQNNATPEVKVVNQEVIHKTVDDNITKIEKLAKLKESGAITQEEFDVEKQKLLNQ